MERTSEHLMYNKSNNCLQSMTQTNRQKKNTKENKIKRNKKDTRKQKLQFFFLHDIFGYVMMDFNFNVKCSQFTHILLANKAYVLHIWYIRLVTSI